MIKRFVGVVFFFNADKNIINTLYVFPVFDVNLWFVLVDTLGVISG